MPNLHVLLLQVVVGLVAVAEGAPCRHQIREACNDVVAFHRDQGRADSSRLDLDSSYLDASAAPLAAPPSSGFNTDRMERWEERDFVDEEMEEELERWYEQWHGVYGNEGNIYNDNGYDGDDKYNEFGPYPTTYNHLSNERSTPVTQEDFETMYPLTSSPFHIGSDIPPPPSSKQLTYPPPRPASSVPGAVLAPALTPSADTLTSSQANALTSLHKEHIAQFSVLNERIGKQVSATKEKHAKNIANILGVPMIEVQKSGRPKYVDLGKLDVQQTRELVIYSQFVEFELRALFQKQMEDRVRLLRAQRNEWEGLQQKLGVKVVAEGQQGSGEQKNVYWGGLDQGDVGYYGKWLDKRGEEEDESDMSGG